MCCVEQVGRRGGVLGSLGSRTTQDGLSNRVYGCLGLIDAIESSLGGGTNSRVISPSGFIDDGLKSVLWKEVMREIQARPCGNHVP